MHRHVTHIIIIYIRADNLGCDAMWLHLYLSLLEEMKHMNINNIATESRPMRQFIGRILSCMAAFMPTELNNNNNNMINIYSYIDFMYCNMSRRIERKRERESMQGTESICGSLCCFNCSMNYRWWQWWHLLYNNTIHIT